MIAFSIEDITKYCGADSYKKGVACARKDNFIKLFIQADVMSGLYTGTVGVYRVIIHFKNNIPVYSWCTCPAMSSYCDQCKHIAALMILWNKSPRSFVILDSWKKLLENKNSDETLKLLVAAASKSIDTTNILYEALTGKALIEHNELYDHDEGW